jgi:tRNA(His) 5'-end guanylyltransferase
MSDKTSLGDRMKSYENCFKNKFPDNLPIVIRIDGKAFHSWTRGFQKPLDSRMVQAMQETTKTLCEKVQGAALGYVQSDEISILLYPWHTRESQAWFGNEINKILSISASIATASFISSWCEINDIRPHQIVQGLPNFDSRAFILPNEQEVTNYFIWRQQDAVRNSIQTLGQYHFSHKELHKKSCKDIQEMLFSFKGINWNDCPLLQKRGSCVVKEDGKWIIDDNIPTFTEDRNYITDRMKKDEEV